MDYLKEVFNMTMERLKLMHELWERELSDSTREIIVQILKNTRINQGYEKAEIKAKRIRNWLESNVAEVELVRKLKRMEEGRSVILIIRSLNNMDLHESTVKRVLSIISNTHQKCGEEAAEETVEEVAEEAVEEATDAE